MGYQGARPTSEREKNHKSHILFLESSNASTQERLVVPTQSKWVCSGVALLASCPAKALDVGPGGEHAAPKPQASIYHHHSGEAMVDWAVPQSMPQVTSLRPNVLHSLCHPYHASSWPHRPHSHPGLP